MPYPYKLMHLNGSPIWLITTSRFKTFIEFQTTFNSRWGDKKENRHLLAALTETKKKENETIEEFNKKFNDLVSRLHKDIKPPDASILSYYTEAFEGEMRY